jgi:hypothetical protein
MLKGRKRQPWQNGGGLECLRPPRSWGVTPATNPRARQAKNSVDLPWVRNGRRDAISQLLSIQGVSLQAQCANSRPRRRVACSGKAGEVAGVAGTAPPIVPPGRLRTLEICQSCSNAAYTLTKACRYELPLLNGIT